MCLYVLGFSPVFSVVCISFFGAPVRHIWGVLLSVPLNLFICPSSRFTNAAFMSHVSDHSPKHIVLSYEAFESNPISILFLEFWALASLQFG